MEETGEERQQIPSVQLWVKTIALDDNDITLSLEKNDAGSFIRVAGRTPDERVLVPVVGALRMESILKDMFKIHEDTQPLHVEADRADLIKSISLYVGKKQLFFDLKENNRGRFLRISKVNATLVCSVDYESSSSLFLCLRCSRLQGSADVC